MLLEGHIFSLIIFCILISSSLCNVFDSVFWSIREVVLLNCGYIYLCISNAFENGLMNYFSRTQIFVTYKYIIIFRIVFFRFSLYILIHRYGTKVADEKSFKFFWSTKSNPPHKFPLDNKATFSRRSVDKTERNSSGRVKVKDNKYTEVSMSIQESVWGYNSVYV